jgi:hypothetical protein
MNWPTVNRVAVAELLWCALIAVALARETDGNATANFIVGLIGVLFAHFWKWAHYMARQKERHRD